MQSTPPERAPDIFILPDTRSHRLTVRVSTTESGRPEPVNVRVTDTPVEASVDAGGECVLPFPEYTPWTPDEPQCYTLTAEGADWQQSIRFGMRALQMREGVFTLNSHRFPARMTRCRPAPSSSPATMIRAFEDGRKAGFNGLVLESTDFSDEVLDACDTLGLLLWLPLTPPELRNRDVLASRIQPWRNHACIAGWTLPEPDQPAAEAEKTRDAWVDAVRRLDPTRLLVHWGVPATSRLRGSAGWYVQPHQNGRNSLVCLRLALGQPSQPASLRFLEAMPRLEVPVIAIDDGLPAPSPGDTALAQEVAARRLDTLFAPAAESGVVAAQQPQALAAADGPGRYRALRALAGYCWGALTDSDAAPWDGLLDAQARPKTALMPVSIAQQPMHLVVHMPQRAVSPREEVAVQVSLVSDAPNDERADLSLQVVGPTGQVLWKKRRSARLAKYGGPLWSGHVSASGSSGPHRFVVRLLKGPRRLAESSAAFHVHPAPEAPPTRVEVVDPDGAFAHVWSGLVRRGRGNPDVVVLPPLANTVRAYPADELAQMLAEVREGASGIVFEPPADWDDLAHAAGAPEADREPTGAALHYARLHPVFEGLPARAFLGPAYQAVIPRVAFSGATDEDVCGCLQLDGQPRWGHHIRVRRHGAGRIYYVSLRVFDAGAENPLAARLFINLVRHAAGAALTDESAAIAEQTVIGWVREQRHDHTRRWLVTGLFPNWDGAGHDTVMPPEANPAPDAVYTAPHGRVQWKPWWSLAQEGHDVDLFAACGLPLAGGHEGVPGCGYAYAEFTAPAREQVRLHVSAEASLKVWVNAALVCDERRDCGTPPVRDAEASAWVRQGRNTLLVKVSAHLTPARFALEFESERGPQTLTWWR